jgi:hydroxyethylthiazole kinase
MSEAERRHANPQNLIRVMPAEGVPMTSTDMAIDDVYAALEDLRARRPLVHNITNYVAMTISANVLLALGASPAMVHAVEEVEDFLAISDALCVNIGTLSPPWVEAMHLAVARANTLGKPWVLDPVGCGATPYRTKAAADLATLKPTIIRGNASEILSLAGQTGAGKGVDSTASTDDAVGAAAALAQRTGSVVAVTGAVDYVCDGATQVEIHAGHELMPLSTALGCSLSAVTAAFAAVRPPREAAIAALAVFGAAGSAAAQDARGPGHLPADICDALHSMDRATLARFATLRY